MTCCISCGRDTRARDWICADCDLEKRRKMARARSRREDDGMPLEDDYSEDSDADSVAMETAGYLVAPETMEWLRRLGLGRRFGR